MYSPLSNDDLNDYMKELDKKGVQIFDTNTMTPNTKIEEIYNGRGHAVFFAGPNNAGHWIATLRNPQKEIFFIDSFAEHPDYYNPNIMKCFKNNGIKKVHINNKVLQGKNSQVCGRYAVVLAGINKMHMDPNLMIDFLKDGGKKYGSVDKFILKLSKK